MRSRIAHPLAVLTVAFAGACAVPVGGDEEPIEDEEAYLDPGVQDGDVKMDGDTTVAMLVTGTCSTAPLRGLSMQIAEEIRCIAPDLLVPIEETSRIKFQSGAVLPYLSSETAQALRDASQAEVLQLNSGMRSVAQQYLLKRWQQQGRCGIRVAASPGRSNHETGRALDLSNSSSARPEMRSEGFTTLRNDPPHFDHLSSPDLRSVNVEAFQRLWNRNHPEDPIAEDGIYGSETAERLLKSPAQGFATGAVCGA
jgi:hypothetical protein